MEFEVPKNYTSQMIHAYQLLANHNIIFSRDAPILINEIWSHLKEYPNRIKLNPTMILLVNHIISEHPGSNSYEPYIEKFMSYESKFKDIFPKYNNIQELLNDFIRYLYVYFQSTQNI